MISKFIQSMNSISEVLKYEKVESWNSWWYRFCWSEIYNLLDNHPYFQVVAIAASAKSTNKSYEEAVSGRWKLDIPIPDSVKNIIVKNVYDIDDIKRSRLCFCAVDMNKDEIKN